MQDLIPYASITLGIKSISSQPYLLYSLAHMQISSITGLSTSRKIYRNEKEEAYFWRRKRTVHASFF
ncbi:hypothetical protein DXA38_10850 [[Clostridium] innocuum]|uniref:Uncharacterized protein n=1 Tax=Clostridium innocuum TaxID=1522 RepID=A0A3E2VVR6_CLOIN|nr:hypothetical protein DXA38_10850 [[Clostridium] innocuum]RHV65511.1 hypothetical protein DXB22_08215 [Clostridiaceae bacterium OM02-2AC]